MNAYRKIKQIDKLKHIGHDLIDEIEALGVKRHKSYSRMARLMRVPLQEAHFMGVTDVRKLERMVEILENFRDDVSRHKRNPKKRRKKPHVFKISPAADIVRVPKPPKPPRKDYGRNTLPRDQMIRAFAEMKSNPTLSYEWEGAARPIPQTLFQRLLGFIRVVQ